MTSLDCSRRCTSPESDRLSDPAPRSAPTGPVMTLDDAVEHFLADAPPMTPLRWTGLRTLLDVQAVGAVRCSGVSRQTIDSRV